MSWFRRTNKSSAETDYLQTTETVSRPLALVFTIIIVLVMAAAVFSLFLGGRWLFQHLDGSDKPDTTLIVTNPITETTPSASSTSSDNSSNASTNTSGSQNTSNNTASSTAANSSNTTTNTTQATNTSTTSSSSAATSIPATGTSETAFVFVVTVLLGFIVHTLWLRRLNS